MKPFQFQPDLAVKEMQAFGGKLSRGLQTLSEIGDIDVGFSRKEEVHRDGKMALYHYMPLVPSTNSVPLLIVYALVNRPYMADLQENRSLVRGLLNGGNDVYLIDWGYPDSADRFLTLSDYIDLYIDSCVDVICARHKVDKLNLLGICQGGAFSLCYSALYSHKVKNLITTVTPVDFHTEKDVLSHWVRKVDIDLLVDTIGNVPGEMLNWTFLSLKPFRLSGQKYLDMVDALEDPSTCKNFMRMEKWIFDSPDQAGEAFREFIKQFYQANGLIQGQVRIGDRSVDLHNVTMPVLNIFAKDDHLVPPDSSRALKRYVGTSDYSELEFPGGHIGIYVSSKAQKMIPPAVTEWLASR